MPDSYAFSAEETAAVQPLQSAGAAIAKADFEGRVSLPYDVKCEGKNLKAGQYFVSVKSEGENRVVTLHGSGQNVNVRVHEVPANRAASQSVLMVRKAGDGRSVEALYVKALTTTLYLDSSLKCRPVGKPCRRGVCFYSDVLPQNSRLRLQSLRVGYQQHEPWPDRRSSLRCEWNGIIRRTEAWKARLLAFAFCLNGL